MKTLKQFVQYAESYRGINPRLVRAVVRQSGGWESFCENAPDINEHGIGGGFHGWIYYYETEPFAAKNRAMIAELAEALADDMGEDAISLVRGFNCLDDVSVSEVSKALYGSIKTDDTGVLNALAWFACEEVARAYQDACDEDA